MNKLFTKLTLAFTAFAGVLCAQQDPQFTQFMHNKLIYNPGYAGTSQAICGTAVYRQQWVNFPGAPKTAMLSIDMPIGRLPIGIGLNVMNDQIGFSKTNFARLALAYNRTIGAGVLGVGVDGGILQQQFNGTWIPPETGNDQSIPGQGSYGNNANLNKITYDLGFGVFYNVANTMYVGLSSTHLAAQDIAAGGTGNVKYQLARHYYLMAGYRFKFGANQQHGIEPNIKVKTDAASTQVDVNLTYWFQNSLWIGATYRLQDCIAPMLGYKFTRGGLSGLKAGYSYDLTTSKIKGYSAGTHEIMIGYCFKPKDKPRLTTHSSVRLLD